MYDIRKMDVFYSACSEDHHLIQLNALSGTVSTAALLARGEIPYSLVTGFQEK